MSHNRLVLICKTCCVEPWDWVKDENNIFCLGKYLPSDGWYTSINDIKQLNDFLVKHSQCSINNQFSMWGGHNFKLEYEINDKPTNLELDASIFKSIWKNRHKKALQEIDRLKQELSETRVRMRTYSNQIIKHNLPIPNDP